MSDESTTNGGDGGSIWDRIWGRRASSHRRNLANVAIETARVAALIAEGSRIIDEFSSDDRTMALHEIANEIVGLARSSIAVAEHFRTEAGPLAYKRPRATLFQKVSMWFQRLSMWLSGWLADD